MVKTCVLGLQDQEAQLIGQIIKLFMQTTDLISISIQFV